MARSEPSFKIYWGGWLIFALCALGAVIAFQVDDRQAVTQKTVTPKAQPEDPYDLSDRTLRAQFASWDEMKLRMELTQIASLQLGAPVDPELTVRKALVAEALARYDGMRGANHWSDALTPFKEAIEQWFALKSGRMVDDRPRRVAMLHLYAGQACVKKAMFTEAWTHFNAAERHADLQQRARAELAKLPR